MGIGVWRPRPKVRLSTTRRRVAHRDCGLSTRMEAIKSYSLLIPIERPPLQFPRMVTTLLSLPRVRASGKWILTVVIAVSYPKVEYFPATQLTGSGYSIQRNSKDGNCLGYRRAVS